ncbi:hypothetical protein [Vibrio profundi]|uniref:hypothetical protein n=1 Tax=Vibrio profundi TaxID=1774960 RepID=UPI003734D0A0
MNELREHCNQIDVHLSEEEVKHLGWSEDKGWIIESVIFLMIVVALCLLIWTNMFSK